VLDEPTNDLDLETLDLLQEMLCDFAGTILLVSHDRDFLDRVVTSVLMSEGQGRWLEYAGGYSDMVFQRGAGVSAAPVRAVEKRKAEKSSSGDRKTPSKARLNFKEKHALETLPARMEALCRDMGKLRALLDDPGLYARDPAKFAKASEAYSKAESELSVAEEEWLELEIRREEIGGIAGESGEGF